MTKSGVCYAIRVGPGLYSRAPKRAPAPIHKARLWTSVGHVKNHLRRAGDLYPSDAAVVEVVVEYRETNVLLVGEFIAQHDREEQARLATARKQSALREVALAKEQLERAKRAAVAAGVVVRDE